ncbi:MAG: glycerol-3-phosphate dehydrogenase/oxidase [Dehalococcoidia bacterium]
MGGRGIRLEDLAAGPPLDAAVIGGGINGCAIAASAAAAGHRVALFEQDDFGFGTTWRSTKLIHGGLRYLEHGETGLVRESLRERRWLLRTRPHLVRPLRFLLPQLPWTRRPRWQVAIGLTLYDFLALDRTIPRHRRIRADLLRRAAPGIAAEADGGFAYYDARALLPERLALELALEAEAAGGWMFNHAPVRRIEVRSGRVHSLTVERDGREITLAARVIVNAAGPWVDAVAELAGEPEPLLTLTRGTHIVVEPAAGQLPRDAILSTARSDGRVFFAIPQDGLLLIGTTDEPYAGDPAATVPTRHEVDYLVAEAQALLPGLDITHDRVRYAFAGLRPLRRATGRAAGAISRRHDVIDHARHGAAGLYSVAGGKLSTFRPLARVALGRAGLDAGPFTEPGRDGHWRRLLDAADIPDAARRHLRVYGPRLGEVLEAGRELLCPHSGLTSGEVVHAVLREHAITLSDVLLRRTGACWATCRGLCAHHAAAEVAGPLLGWDDGERVRQVAMYKRDVARHLPALDEVADQ